MSTPFISVVIPTFNRPQFLPHAVESALTCHGEGVEVVVVPNGPDQTWKTSLARWQFDPRVRTSPIETAHGNVARNHGMALARGKYIRFLDDDDYLLPAVREQAEMLEQSGADMCSGLVARIDIEGTNWGAALRNNEKDFVCATAAISGFTLTTGNLYRRAVLEHANWDESIRHFQDDVWMMGLAASREWSWIHCDKEVGVWLQHNTARVSSQSMFTGLDIPSVASLLELFRSLERSSRLNPQRRRAIAAGLWDYIHRGFPYHPLYWTGIARRALAIHHDAKPSEAAFESGVLRKVNPLLGEWLVFPIRRITRAIRDTRAKRHEP